MPRQLLTQPLTIVVVTIATSLLSFNSQAATTVFEQAPAVQVGQFFSGSGSYVRNDLADPGFNWVTDTDMQSWEYFSLAAPVNVNRIGWYGNNADGNFAVDLFTVTCFSCNAVPVNGNGGFTHTSINPGNGPSLLPTTAFSQADVHKTLVAHAGVGSSQDVYSYYVDLGAKITLPTATGMNGYGISIVNNYSSNPFVWASATTNGPHLVYTMTYASYMFLRSPGDLAFSLVDTTSTPNVSPVPEPETCAMLLAGLGLVAGVVRRRRQTGPLSQEK
jgi:hypothetical protein